jgi:hypothetical protein
MVEIHRYSVCAGPMRLFLRLFPVRSRYFLMRFRGDNSLFCFLSLLVGGHLPQLLDPGERDSCVCTKGWENLLRYNRTRANRLHPPLSRHEEQYEATDAEVKIEAAAAAHFAEESPPPTEVSIFEDVYFEVDRQSKAALTGRFFFNGRVSRLSILRSSSSNPQLEVPGHTLNSLQCKVEP